MSQFGQKVVAVIDTQSAFGVTVKTLKENVDTLTGQMSTLLADAPETLDTLNEIAAAISDDPAFFTTMATANTTLQANITALSTAAASARTALQTALQTNIDAEALTGTNARGVLSGRLDSLELDPVTKTYVDAAVTNLIDAAPGVLNTLNEIAAALGDDANFATTVTNNIATVQADVDANEAAALAARNAIQADVDANETTAAALVTTLETARNVITAAISTRVATLEADPTTATAVAAVQADVNANEADADTAIATKFDKTGGVLTGSLVVAKSFPDLQLKANDEKRLLFSDAGGGSTAAIKHVSSTLDFFAGGIAASNKEMSIGTDGVDVSALKIAGTAVTATAAEINAVDGRLDTLEADPTTATALAAVQSDVDANETASDAAEAALSTRLDTLEADPTTATAVAAVQTDVDANQVTAANAVTAQNTAMLAAVAVVQADVDQNETDADAAINTEKARIDAILAGSAADKDTFAEIVTLINSVDTTNDNAFAGYVTSNNAAVAAVQADVNQNETDADAAIAAVQADVDANETAAATLVSAENTVMLAAVAVVQADVDQNETDADAAIAAVQADVDQNESDADTAIALKADTAGDTFTGDILLKNPSGNAVALRLSRTDNSDMNTEWKVQPSYVSIDKECLSIMAGSAVVASFDERQRLAVNTTDPDYTLDVGGDGNFSTNLTVGGTVNLTLTNAANDSAAASAGVAVNQLYRNGSVVMIRVS